MDPGPPIEKYVLSYGPRTFYKICVVLWASDPPLKNMCCPMDLGPPIEKSLWSHDGEGSSHEERCGRMDSKRCALAVEMGPVLSAYEMGGGWELQNEGVKHDLEPYIGRLDPKP